MEACPLCENSESIKIPSPNFLKCSCCDLVFRPRHLLLGPEIEKSRYQLHENHLDNPGYKEFLQPAIQCLTDHMPKGAIGLDYGCGPTKALSQWASDLGFPCTAYDPYFAPINLDKQHHALDFILCTEAAEHFYEPKLEFPKIFQLLKPSGSLILMTERVFPNTKLSDWYYAREDTHVSFYSDMSMQWLAKKYNKKLSLLSPKLCLFKA